MKSRFISNDEGCDQAAADIEYAAPVRTKDPCNPLQDLTDDEIWEIYFNPEGYQDFTAIARAVIQEFRRKNGIV